MAVREFEIRVAWDAEGQGWYVAESDIPGLNAEADTLEDLIGKVRVMAAELVDLNRNLLAVDPHADIPIHVMAERSETVRLGA